MRWLEQVDASRFVRWAISVGLVALVMMALSVLFPHPLMVIAAMSIGQVLGGLALVCYLGAIAFEVRRNSRRE